MAHLVLQDQMDVVGVQLGVAVQDVLSPLRVLLQGLGVTGGGSPGHQQVGQVKELLLQAAGRTARPMTSIRPMFSFLMWWSFAWG